MHISRSRNQVACIFRLPASTMASKHHPRHSVSLQQPKIAATLGVYDEAAAHRHIHTRLHNQGRGRRVYLRSPFQFHLILWAELCKYLRRFVTEMCALRLCWLPLLLVATGGGWWGRIRRRMRRLHTTSARARVGEHRNRENIPFVPCAALPIIDSCGTGKTRGKHGRKTCVCVLFAATATAITLFILIRLVA